MKRENIRALIRKGLGETTESFWSNTELNTWINDACHDLAFRTKCIRDNGYLTTIADTAEYSLSTNFTGILAITELYFYQDGSSWQKLKPTTRTKLDIEHPGWLGYSSGTPTEYYWDIDEDVLGFLVKPNSDNAGSQYARVYYAKDCTEMTTDTDTTGMPVFLDDAVISYVIAKGFGQRGYGSKENDMWQKYYGRIKDFFSERRREREDDEIIMRGYRSG